MTRMQIAFPVLLLSILLLSCSSTKEVADEEQKPPMPPQVGPGVAPGHCRIVATVMTVENDRSANADDPCSKAPCLAVVRVDEVLGVGSGFANTLHKGSEIRVRFSLTLRPTNEILPNVTPPLPGLVVGSKFQADVADGPSPKTEERVYQTALYRVKE